MPRLLLSLLLLLSGVAGYGAQVVTIATPPTVKNAGGAPKISEDTIANRPTAGTAGALFFATDTKVMYRDNGSSWDALAVGGGAAGAVTTLTVTPTVATSGVQKAVTVTGSADTTQTASTEKIDVDFALNRTVQWATSVPSPQRAVVFRAPTYSCDTASQTMAFAATVDITGAPAAGTNVTITNPYALRVEAGDCVTGNGQWFVQVNDAVTNTVSNDLTLYHYSSGTPSTGFGERVQFNGHSSTNTVRNMGLIDCVWTTATDASRVSSLKFWTYNVASPVTSLTLGPTSASFDSAVPVTFNNTTDATSKTTGATISSGGISAAKNIIAGQGIASGVTSTATAAGTTTLTSASVGVQIFTGATTQTVQLPAANLFGAGVSVQYTLINRSSGSVSWARAGSDTINGATSNVAVTTNTVGMIWSDGVSAWYTK
jgi:hypothetical protein